MTVKELILKLSEHDPDEFVSVRMLTDDDEITVFGDFTVTRNTDLVVPFVMIEANGRTEIE